MWPLLWLQLLLVSLGSREILGDEVPTDSTTVVPAPTPSQAGGKSVDDDSIKPKMEDQTASALLVPSAAVDGTTNAPIPSMDIESADPIPLANKKRASDSDTAAADAESAEKSQSNQVIDDSESKQNENILLIDKVRVSRQQETTTPTSESTTPQPQSTTAHPTGPKKRQSLVDSSESIESLPVGVISDTGDASATAYFTGDPKRRVSLSHDEFSQMLNQVLKQNQMYGNVQQDNVQSIPAYLRQQRPLQVEKFSESDKDSEGYFDDGRQTGYQVDDPHNNDGPIYISVPVNKDFQQFQPKPQKPLNVFKDIDAPTPTTKRPPIDPPTEAIPQQQQPQQQRTHQQQFRPAIKDLPPFPVLQAGAPPPQAPPNPIVPAPPPVDPVLPANPNIPGQPPGDPVLSDNPNIPGQPPVGLIIHVNPSAPHISKPPFNPTRFPASKPPLISPVGHEHGLLPPNNAVPKPPSPNNVVIPVPMSRTNSTPTTNVTVPPSCPTLLEFLNASKNVWQGIAQAGGLQAGLGVFFKAAGKVISTLTQCAKAILAEIGALFYQGVVEKMLGQLDDKSNGMNINTAENIKTTDGRRQADQRIPPKRNTPAGNPKKGRRYKKHIPKGAAGSSVNGDFIEAEIEEMDLEAEDEVTPDPGNVRGRKETESKAQESAKESVQDNEDDTLLKVDNIEPGMY